MKRILPIYDCADAAVFVILLTIALSCAYILGREQGRIAGYYRGCVEAKLLASETKMFTYTKRYCDAKARLSYEKNLIDR